VDRREFDQEKILSMAYQEYIKTIDDEQRVSGS
jgi:hypothetical protein